MVTKIKSNPWHVQTKKTPRMCRDKSKTKTLKLIKATVNIKKSNTTGDENKRVTKTKSTKQRKWKRLKRNRVKKWDQGRETNSSNMRRSGKTTLLLLRENHIKLNWRPSRKNKKVIVNRHHNLRHDLKCHRVKLFLAYNHEASKTSSYILHVFFQAST